MRVLVPGQRGYTPDASPDVSNYRVSGDRFADAVGFCAEWDARAGASELADAFIATRLFLAEVEGPRFQRIAMIRQRLAEGSLGPDLRRPAAPGTGTVSQLTTRMVVDEQGPRSFAGSDNALSSRRAAPGSPAVSAARSGSSRVRPGYSSPFPSQTAQGARP